MVSPSTVPIKYRVLWTGWEAFGERSPGEFSRSRRWRSWDAAPGEFSSEPRIKKKKGRRLRAGPPGRPGQRFNQVRPGVRECSQSQERVAQREEPRQAP